MEIKKGSSTKEMIITSLMVALIFLAGSVIKIPSIGGFIHIGDCMVFLSVIIFGKRRGAISSALGMFLVDVAAGYYIWAPFTFIIKFIMAYVTGFIIERMDDDYISNFKMKYIFAFLVGGVFMIFGYFLAGGIIAVIFTEDTGIIQGLAISAKDIIGNIIEVTTGIVLAVPLSNMLLKAKRSCI